ncbi:hypothetical protein AB0C33_41330 [Nonomuraea sp. NPDC048881]|uniref:hypothetical protein n=1 Tax=Nonomuraea sp. NPDC048881 TaxID=3155030 RepID=UPI00340DC587
MGKPIRAYWAIVRRRSYGGGPEVSADVFAKAKADVFAKAKNALNWLIGHLTDAQTGTLPHNRLEETITEQGLDRFSR